MKTIKLLTSWKKFMEENTNYKKGKKSMIGEKNLNWDHVIITMNPFRYWLYLICQNESTN